MTLVLVLLLGLLGGLITTVAGLGGGLVMVAILSVALDPVTALSATAIGLLVGNLHRVWMYRRRLDWRSALPMVAGAIPGALVFGFLIAWFPEWLIFGIMLVMGVVAVGRAMGWDDWPVPAWAGAPLGVLVGGVTATSGGGGLIVAPWLLARGLVGASYVGTVGIVAVSLHISRIIAYGAGGASDGQSWLLGGVLALALPVGNLLGHVIRKRIPLPAQRVVQLGTLVVCLGVAGFGFAEGMLTDESTVAEASEALDAPPASSESRSPPDLTPPDAPRGGSQAAARERPSPRAAP